MNINSIIPTHILVVVDKMNDAVCIEVPEDSWDYDVVAGVLARMFEQLPVGRKVSIIMYRNVADVPTAVSALEFTAPSTKDNIFDELCLDELWRTTKAREAAALLGGGVVN